MNNILVSSLEPSANLHLEPVLKNLKTYSLKGIFDLRFGKPLYPSSDFSVMGFVDILFKIKKAKKAIEEMVKLSFECDKVLLIDSPAFNLPLAKAIKKKNPTIEIIYYILPQVWAWKEKRVKKVEKYCDKLASILPFESEFYNKAHYVGHPLLDEITNFKTEITNNKKVAFLPGSRKSEIKFLMKIYREIANKIKEEKILVIPKHFQEEEIKEIYGDIKDFTICKNTEDALNKSDFAFICSGTATLEAAIIGTPFVLTYKAKKIDYFLAKKFVHLKHIGLANIIFDFNHEEPMHDEYIQDELTLQNLLNAYKNLDREQFIKKAKRLRTILEHGSAKEVSNMLVKI